MTYQHIIERFHSRGQHLCKFIGTKESVYIRKDYNSHRIVLEVQHGRRFIVLEIQYGRDDVMRKTPYLYFKMNKLCVPNFDSVQSSMLKLHSTSVVVQFSTFFSCYVFYCY